MIFYLTNVYLQIDYQGNNGSQDAATTGAATIKTTTSHAHAMGRDSQYHVTQYVF
jgi:hypothetical protein